jgi:transcriptional repressor NrdR
MKCPYCGTFENRVIDSRLSQGGEVTRRRRECEKCGRRYTTYERVEQILPMVLKRDGRREPFDRVKLLQGIRRAVVKRPVDAEAVEAIVDSLERTLLESGDREITSQALGEAILARLKDLDPVAYIRFASVYRQFGDLDEFVAELARLQGTAVKKS